MNTFTCCIQRSIVDNIHLAQELLRKYARKRVSKRCILKVDVQKAYDTVDWAFLEEVLIGFNFPSLFVKWIMECVSTTSYSIALNGTYHGHFKGERELRQGMDDRTRHEILRMTGFTPGMLPFRYLGIPLAAKRLRSSDYCMLVNAIAAKINSWPRHSLSYAGKLELIRSVIQGIECFWLSVLPVPNCVIDSIHSLCRKFVWPTKRPLIAWNTLCKPLADGGLGLKNLRAWNLALIAKTLWKIHLKKDNLWIKWINHIYSNFGDVWNWKWHKDESPLIKHIISIRDTLLQRLGSATNASATLHCWFAEDKGMSRAYDWFANSKGNWPWKPLLTRSFILPKHRIILWLVAHAKLLTRDRLPFVDDKPRVLCNTVNESTQHLFFSCHYSASVWNEVRDWLGMWKMMGSPSAVLKAFQNCYRGNSTLSRMRITALASTVYFLWNARNKTMFEDDKPRVEDIVRRIKINVFRCIPCSIDVCQLVVYS
ncbi:uncharacterized protein LOC142544859 isoform X1 [Primulina tabacum]|uniref:uncharacterized protein LOC142544859 isoform X1 n=1 Tax=Primulina tabacum TaxID=48773 RepID=UPI003F592840